MQRLRYVASVASLLLLLPSGNACADPYDGQWSGAATVTSGACKPGTIALTVRGTTAAGQARFAPDTRDIHGTVTADGTLGATIGFLHLTGTFTGDMFEGTFQSHDCVWKVVLKRAK